MNLEQIDQLLADWKKKVDLVGQNLIDLHGLPTYQRLTGASGFPKSELTGVTTARVTPALEAMNDLCQYFDLLLKTVNRATELRSSVQWFLGAEQLREIEQVLVGPSIQLPVQMPLAQRGLLTAAETATSIAPEQLLTSMTNAFQIVRDVVLAVDEAWLRLEPILADAEAETTSLQKLADLLGVSCSIELSTARQQIATLRTSIESDPLGASADFDREINPLILRVKTTLGQLVKQQTQLREDIAIAHELLNKLMELHTYAAAAYAESTLKVVEHSSLQAPLEREKIDALEAWLTRLETKFAEGFLNPVRVGIENWTIKVKEYTVAEEKACAANRMPLETRAELRGRLDALTAKALAQGSIEDSTLTELAEKTKQLLYTRPTPLEKAAELISQYQKRLNSQSHSLQIGA